MKKHAFLLLIIGLFFTKFSFGQKLSVKDSINTFYDSLFYHLESRFLYKGQVNWTQVKPYIKQKALKSSSFGASLKITRQLFDTVGGSHLLIFSKYGFYNSTLGRRLTAKDFHIEFIKKYEQKPPPPYEVKVLNNQYGYVMIPGMLLDVSKDSLNRKTQAMYDAFMDVQQNYKIKGWIIDLRLNEGGNVYPMATALYHLLGDTIVYRMLGIDKKPIKDKDHTLKNGAFYSGNKMETFAKVRAKPDTNLPVALIIGVMTNSAGEMTALPFRGRNNTIMIGEDSYGSLTGNNMVKLPYGVKLALTTGYTADPQSIYTKRIYPSIKVIRQANFQDLTKDQNIIEAIKFIDAKHQK